MIPRAAYEETFLYVVKFTHLNLVAMVIKISMQSISRKYFRQNIFNLESFPASLNREKQTAKLKYSLKPKEKKGKKKKKEGKKKRRINKRGSAVLRLFTAKGMPLWIL